jgi:hypothetical protein
MSEELRKEIEHVARAIRNVDLAFDGDRGKREIELKAQLGLCEHLLRLQALR